MIWPNMASMLSPPAEALGAAEASCGALDSPSADMTDMVRGMGEQSMKEERGDVRCEGMK
jgi:hypothetical protein